MKKEQIVYVIGIAFFGLGYYSIKTMLDNDILFIAFAAVYLIGLKILAQRIK